jgi:hypothetical protein
MPDFFDNDGRRRWALLTGISLIVMAVLAGIGYGYGFQGLLTYQKSLNMMISAEPFLPLLTITLYSFSTILILDIGVAAGIYKFFAKTDKVLSIIGGSLRLFYTAFLGGAVIHLLELQQLSHAQGLIAPKDIAIHLNGFLSIWNYGLVIFGFHLITVGYLALKSKEIPAILSLLIMIAGVSYCVTSALESVLPTLYHLYKPMVETILGAPMALGELGLAGWLIFKGGKLH